MDMTVEDGHHPLEPCRLCGEQFTEGGGKLSRSFVTATGICSMCSFGSGWTVLTMLKI
ncbi:MAG: hypothetical protein ACI9DF_002570 [Verrucomicrobiales bacterium]|jgi:hypothetical protein